MLAGVAFTDAGVRVLLLAGVTPLQRHQHRIKTKNNNTRPELGCRGRLLTWHRILVVIFEPAEEAVDRRKYLRAIPKAVWSDGYIFYPAKLNKIKI